MNDIYQELNQKYSGKKKKPAVIRKLQNAINEMRNNCKQITIFPKGFIESVLTETKKEKLKLTFIALDIKIAYDNLTQTNCSLDDIKKSKKINIQLSEQTEKKLDAVFTAISHIRSTYPYIATAVTDEEFAKIQKTISDIKLGMSKFSYQINNFITNHYHCYGNEIINEIINAIEKMNKIGNDGNEIIKKIKKMNEIDNNEFVKIDITDIIPDLLDIVNNIYDIQCWPFYYKEGLNFK